jgi:predicted dinucleotide-binding enzyme
MKIAVLGTGMVGETIGGKLVSLGHEVKMGSRSATNEKAAAWAKKAGQGAAHGTFADAAAFGELVFNCTFGSVSVAVLEAAGAKNLAGKIIIDVSNPLDMSRGFPPGVTFGGEDSTGEQIQRAFPEAKVVKTLNTVNCNIMINPALIPGDHDVFVSGDDAAAKAAVTGYLRDWFGWKSVIDLGGIVTARGVESYVVMWVQLMGPAKGPNFNIKLMRQS